MWKMLPNITPKIGDKVVKMTGVDVRVSDRCIGCETCTTGVCFADSIHVLDGIAIIDASCRGCGRCVEICPNQAIDIQIMKSDYVWETIESLNPLIILE